jgi:hypothetical protein
MAFIGRESAACSGFKISAMLGRHFSPQGLPPYERIESWRESGAKVPGKVPDLPMSRTYTNGACLSILSA